MADRIDIEINPRLVPLLLRLAEEQDRDPGEVVEEALVLYLRRIGIDVELGPRIGRAVRKGYVGPVGEPGHPREIPLADLFEQIDQGQRERGVEPLSEEDAMRIAGEELHAMRREGGAGRPQRVVR